MTVPTTTHDYASVAVPLIAEAEDGKNWGATLRKGLIATRAADGPTPEGRPYLEVVAPATLPERYTFEADVNGQSFTVRVPTGGVEEGQKFNVPFPAGSDGYSGAAIPRASVPVGHWKDDLCACFRHGICHSVLWNACCCPLVILGQVMQRLRLTWLGNKGTVAQTASTFRILLFITIGIYTLSGLLSIFGEAGQPTDTPSFSVLANGLLAIFCSVLPIVLVCKTRRHIRTRYAIPEQSCHGCEDCCCAYWCTCCAVAQMARHTADYETYAGLCCSETGLPAHTPSIV